MSEQKTTELERRHIMDSELIIGYKTESLTLMVKTISLKLARRNYEMKKMKMNNKGMSADEDNEDDLDDIGMYL